MRSGDVIQRTASIHPAIGAHRYGTLRNQREHVQTAVDDQGPTAPKSDGSGERADSSRSGGPEPSSRFIGSPGIRDETMIGSVWAKSAGLIRSCRDMPASSARDVARLQRHTLTLIWCASGLVHSSIVPGFGQICLCNRDRKNRRAGLYWTESAEASASIPQTRFFIEVLIHIRLVARTLPT